MKIAIHAEQADIPEIYCPFPSQISPHYEAVKRHTHEWALQIGLISNATVLAYYCKADYPGLACRAHPRAGLEELCIASDWLFLISVFDDPYDEGTLDNRQQEISAFHEYLSAVIDDPDRTAPRGPIAPAFADIVRRARPFTSPSWLKRFARHHEEYFAALPWQVANREQRSMPGLQAYLDNRMQVAGALPPFDFIEMTCHSTVPPEIYESQAVQDILRAGIHLIGWTNDIYSANKDMACDDVNNLIMAIQREYTCSLQKAVDRLATMIEAETRYLEMLQHIDTSSPNVERYARMIWIGVTDWVRGHADWYHGNPRYTERATLEEVTSHLVDILATEVAETLDKARVVRHYSQKTQAILHKYGPGPRVHYHLGIFKPGESLNTTVAQRVLQQRITDSQEAVLKYASTLWTRKAVPGSLLDIGCGVGGGSIFWAQEYNATVTGITVVAEHISLVQDFASQAGVSHQVRAVLKDIHDLQEKRVYDAAVAFESSCYTDRKQLFSVVAQALKPGGWFGLMEHFLCRPEWSEFINDYYKTRLGTLPEYLEAASTAGFELEQDEEINAQVSEFWIHSMAWTTAELDRAQSPIARDRLLESALAHGKMFRIWRDHAIETRLLLFRLCN